MDLDDENGGGIEGKTYRSEMERGAIPLETENYADTDNWMLAPVEETEVVIGTTVRVDDGYEGGGEAGVIYRSKSNRTIDLADENYASPSNWEALSPVWQIVANVNATIVLETDTQKPRTDPETLESLRPGIYLAGVIVAGMHTNEIFIENGRFHGMQIADDIAAKLGRAPEPVAVVTKP